VDKHYSFQKMGYTCERCAKEFSEERSLSRHVKLYIWVKNLFMGCVTKIFPEEIIW